MGIDEARIQDIVDRVLERLGETPATPMEAVRNPPPGFARPAPDPPPARKPPPRIPTARRGIFPDVDAAVRAAQKAHAENEASSLEKRSRWIEAMREATRRVAPDISRYAVEETGYGRADDKVRKNLLCANKTPGPERLAGPETFSGDDGLTITERASYGVIGSITPTTNPTETIINNGIGMVAGGNAVVFNVHPYAARTCAFFVHTLNEAIGAAGGPENLLCCVAEPTIESAKHLMRHPGVRLLVVTGGTGVVNEAMQAGKKVIAAGPGNPPSVVDETADLPEAARHIVAGASIDNNIICTAEKEVIATDAAGPRLVEELVAAGSAIVRGPQLRELEKLVIHEGKHPNKDFIGKNAADIGKHVGVRAGAELRLLLAEVDEKHPFVQLELLMPVLPIVRAPDAAQAIAMARRVEHGFGHTASMFSRDIAHLHAMARTINTSIFVKNASNLAGLGEGGEGYTSFTIASPTGEGMTTVRHFTRERRCTLKEYFRFV